MAKALGDVLGQLPMLGTLIKEMSDQKDQSIIETRGLIDCHLANSMGTLSADARKMDDHMKVWIGLTIDNLNKLHTENLSWDTVTESLIHNRVLEPMDDEIFRNDMVNFGGPNSVDRAPSPNDPKIQYVDQ